MDQCDTVLAPHGFGVINDAAKELLAFLSTHKQLCVIHGFGTWISTNRHGSTPIQSSGTVLIILPHIGVIEESVWMYWCEKRGRMQYRPPVFVERSRMETSSYRRRVPESRGKKRYDVLRLVYKQSAG